MTEEPLSYPTDRNAAAEQVDELEQADCLASVSDPVAERQWQLSSQEVLEQLAIWRHTVLSMRIRIFDPHEGTFTLQGDLQLFAMAVRQVLRFAELARNVVPASLRSPIDKALNDFWKSSPDAKNIRDVLDHFDGYLRGRGKKFPAGRPSDHDNAYLQVYRPTTTWTDVSPDQIRLYLAPAPGQKPLVLDVGREADSAHVLTNAVRTVLVEQIKAARGMADRLPADPS